MIVPALLIGLFLLIFALLATYAFAGLETSMFFTFSSAFNNLYTFVDGDNHIDVVQEVWNVG